VLSVSLAREVFQSITVFLNQAQYIRSGIDMKYFGILLVVIQIVRLGSVKAYALSDKFGKYRSIQIFYIAMTLSCILLIFTANPILSVSCVIFISASMSLIEPIALELENKSINTADRATILSIYAMIEDVLAAIINPVIGIAADMSIVVSFKVCLIICIVIFILLFLYKRSENSYFVS
jgi:MFS family permease